MKWQDFDIEQILEKIISQSIGKTQKAVNVVLYQPELYVDLCKEILRQQREINDIRSMEFKYFGLVQKNLELQDEVNELHEQLRKKR